MIICIRLIEEKDFLFISPQKQILFLSLTIIVEFLGVKIRKIFKFLFGKFIIIRYSINFSSFFGLRLFSLSTQITCSFPAYKLHIILF